MRIESILQTASSAPLYNDSGGLTSNTTVIDVTTNYSSSPSFNCREWEEAQNGLFQIANLFYACAFVIPHNFRISILLTRSLLCVGFTMAALWGALYVCALDILAWNTMFVIIQLGHVVYLLWKFCPPYIGPELRELYNKVFWSLKVSKRDFKLLVAHAFVKKLESGSCFVAESNVPSEDGLCILLSGSLAVVCKNVTLHEIKPFEFINSPEWEVQNQNSSPPSVSQVTVFAKEASSYLYWPRGTLNRLSLLDPSLYFVLHCLTGKDVGLKLYSVAENTSNLNEVTRESLGIFRKPAKQELRQYSAFPQSASADEINQAARGQVRSNNWQRDRMQKIAVRMDDPALTIQKFILAGESEPYPLVAPDLASSVQTFIPNQQPKRQREKEKTQSPARRLLRSIKSRRRISKRVSPKQQSSFELETGPGDEVFPETLVTKTTDV